MFQISARLAHCHVWMVPQDNGRLWRGSGFWWHHLLWIWHNVREWLELWTPCIGEWQSHLQEHSRGGFFVHLKSRFQRDFPLAKSNVLRTGNGKWESHFSQEPWFLSLCFCGKWGRGKDNFQCQKNDLRHGKYHWNWDFKCTKNPPQVPTCMWYMLPNPLQFRAVTLTISILGGRSWTLPQLLT